MSKTCKICGETTNGVFHTCGKPMSTSKTPRTDEKVKESDGMVNQPLVLGHPATFDWCLAVDEHHKVTEQARDKAEARVVELEKVLKDAGSALSCLYTFYRHKSIWETANIEKTRRLIEITLEKPAGPSSPTRLKWQEPNGLLGH